jgi:hypothetical protein
MGGGGVPLGCPIIHEPWGVLRVKGSGGQRGDSSLGVGVYFLSKLFTQLNLLGFNSDSIIQEA